MMFSRTYKLDKATGRMVETTPDHLLPICDEISAEVKKVKKGMVKRAANNCWPMHCEALAVNPEDVAEMSAEMARHGCPTSYDDDGCPIWRSPSHRKRYCELVGAYDRDAGYGDPAPKYYVESTHGREAVKSRRKALRTEIRQHIHRIENELRQEGVLS